MERQTYSKSCKCILRSIGRALLAVRELLPTADARIYNGVRHLQVHLDSFYSESVLALNTLATATWIHYYSNNRPCVFGLDLFRKRQYITRAVFQNNMPVSGSTALLVWPVTPATRQSNSDEVVTVAFTG
jgi:hypothetical protein